MTLPKNSLMADISNNDPHLDGKTYREAGHVIIGIKASEGRSFRDPDHAALSSEAGKHGIAVMHYHFARPDLDGNGAAEAEFFLSVAERYLGPRDYVVYDGERAANGAFGMDAGHCREFDTYIQAHTRFHTILYASASVLKTQAKDSLIGSRQRDWCADYSTDPDSHAPGHVPVIRQFTDGVLGPEPHTLAGVGQCDVSILRGNFRKAVLARA